LISLEKSRDRKTGIERPDRKTGPIYLDIICHHNILFVAILSEFNLGWKGGIEKKEGGCAKKLDRNSNFIKGGNLK